jgi:hypothetical protein
MQWFSSLAVCGLFKVYDSVRREVEMKGNLFLHTIRLYGGSVVTPSLISIGHCVWDIISGPCWGSSPGLFSL